MKKQIPFLLLLLILSTISWHATAQQYQCIKRNEKQFFINREGYLRGMRIDNVVASGTDSIYYPFKTKRTPYWSADPPKGSWLGEKVIQKEDGTFYFLTLSGDTAVIRTQADSGESWIFYDKPFVARHYIATVTSCDTMSFLGITDSVKKISLKVVNGTEADSFYTATNHHIILSQHHGFVRVFNIYLIDYAGTDDYEQRVGPYWGNPSFWQCNYHNPTAIEMYDYNPGDEFCAYTYNEVQIGMDYSWEVCDSVITKTLVDPWHIDYLVRRRTISTTYPETPGVPNYVSYSTSNQHIIVDTAKLMHLINAMPEEYTVKDTIYYYRPWDTSYCTPSPYYGVFRIPYFEVCDYRYEYKQYFPQLSLLTFTPPSSYPGCTSSTHSYLSYVKKFGVPCGPAGIPSVYVADSDVSISPNPTSSSITIQATAGLFSLVIYNLLGQIVHQSTPSSHAAEVDVSGLTPGTYLLKINDSIVKRFVKQ